MFAFIMMGVLGLVVGIGLAAASKVFYVYVDPIILSIDDALPGANCGGCGLPGCAANAEAIAAGKAAPNSCVAAGSDVADAIAEIMGVSIEAKEPDIAKPGCTYSVERADSKYFYDGISDCRAASLLSGGMKVCSIGCLGLGSCVEACRFGAVTMGADNLPVVDENRCTGCGACEKACPKHIINLSSVTRRIIREYTSDECTTPCQRACPAGIDISEYVRQISIGDYHRAIQVIKERNPFPTVIGRICPRPCELECRRKYIDEPVAINFLKRCAADYEKENNNRVLPYKAPSTNKKIAVIGGGVEGLSSAYFTARLGHDPMVFEASSQLGGLLRSAIAQYRLPGEILDWDIEGILELGVQVQTGKALGKDVTIDSLLSEEFEVVFLASGGWDSRLAGGVEADIKEPVPGTHLLIDVMRDNEDGSGAENRMSYGNDVVIAGGSSLGLEAARKCLSLGAKKVTLVLREAEDKSPLKEEDLDKIKNEEIHIIYNAGINRLFGEGDKLSGIEYNELDSFVMNRLPADTLIFASGRFPEMIFTEIIETETSESEEGRSEPIHEGPIQWEGIEPYKQPGNGNGIGMFAEDDVITDYSGAIKAIGAAQRAAASIHHILYDLPIEAPDRVITPHSVLLDVDHVDNVVEISRTIMPLGSAKEIDTGLEFEKGFTEDMAKKESARCLQCGLICYQHQENNSGRA